MKIIKTRKFEKLSAWLNTHPPIEPVRDMFKNRNDSEEEIKRKFKENPKKKKKKKLYQLNLEVDDVSLKDFDN